MRPNIEQLHMFDNVDCIICQPDPPLAEESLELLLIEFDVLTDGTIVRRMPAPLKPAWLRQRALSL